ncbi:MAG: EamA family transporter [Propionicimonas sp.]|uniref:DMT family transporter n=1 Tax=Propionicimonas sp. TaxID=1955623 RepID=UPI003D117E94
MRNRGVQAGLLSALLFGAGTPIAKLLLGATNPWLLAGLLYLGSGVGLSLWQLARRAPRPHLARAEWAHLAGAVGFGGIAGPVLLMIGLNTLPASSASLLLNAEAVLTAVIAWVVFREPFDRRVGLGMLSIVAGAIVLTMQGGVSLGSPWPSLAIVGACLCWAIDNNLTRKVSLHDATWLAAIKGGVAGPVNLVLALVLGAMLPSPGNVAVAMAVGLLAYGVSLVLFIVAMRYVGTARAGAYYSVAPFFGALLAVAMGEPVTATLAAASLLMGIGVWLHVTERHEHSHTHQPTTHEHWHTHGDGHHNHEHDDPLPAGTRHSHPHAHAAVTHTHSHFPDAHHRHTHNRHSHR